MNIRKEQGERIAEARIEAGMTQVDAAKSLQVSRQTYLDWESGKTSPKIDIAHKMANLFNVSVQQIIMGNVDYKLASAKALANDLRNVLKGM